VTYEGTPTSVINTGLSHLEGRNVAILADGNVVANYYKPKIVKDGAVNLGASYSKVHIGLPYLADLETLNFDVPTMTGTAQGKKAKISKLSVQVLNSLGGWIGPRFGTLISTGGPMHELGGAFTRYSSNALELFTGDFQENLDAGFEDGARVCIRQADPLPMSILSLVPDITVGGKSLVNDLQ
jgi:hypothetical protein